MSKRNRHKNTRVSSVDVVVTTAGRFDLLRDCLASLDKQIPHNLYVIDNASDSEQRNQNQDVFARTNSKRLQQNVGFPGAANEGARMGSSPLILFLSDDVVLFSETLEKMVSRMNDQSIGVCGAKLMFPPTSTSPHRPAGKVQHVGLGMNIRGDVIHPLVGWSADHPKVCQSREVMATTGACFMIRRNLFSKAGGFDVAYGRGTYEDTDLCFRVRSMGFRIFVDTEAKAYHYVGATAENRQEGFPIQQNSAVFRARWGGTPLYAWDEFSWW